MVPPAQPARRIQALLASLAKPETYLRELDRLRKRQLHNARNPRTQAGLALHDWDHTLCRKVARELARAVPRGEYALGPVSAREAVIGGKARVLYRASITDTVVLAALARVLAALIEPLLSDRLFSYRAGRSALMAAREFSAYLRSHAAERRDPRARGLFVLRRDVARYGENIPVTDGAPLFAQLRNVLANAGLDDTHFLHALLLGAVHPVVLPANARLDRGVPTGSPIQPAICNLYLSSLDRALAGIPGSFYARFGDDILFAHPELEVAERAAAQIDDELARLGLELKQEKRRDLFFNGAGRAHPNMPGAQYVEYLGLRLSFDGSIGLTREKAARIQANCLRRVQNTLLLTGNDAIRELVGGVLQRALNPRIASSEPLLGLIRYAVDDRAQLRNLDYFIARAVAQRLTRKRGARAFRACSYRRLREAGVPSLLRLKDRARPGTSKPK